MILYYAMTNYHVLNCILHRLKYHSDEKCILYLSEWHPKQNDLIKKIKKSNFFDDVLLFHEVVFPAVNYRLDKTELDDYIKVISNSIHNNLDFDLKKFDEINICGDHYGLSVYLNYFNIKYNYFEDGAGILSKNDILLSNIKVIDYSRYQILNYLKLPGDSENIVNRYGDLSSQLEKYRNSKDIDFSVKDELKKVGNYNLKNMINIFSNFDKNIGKLDDYDILLTFHYNNLGIFTLDEQRQFYSYLLDYFNVNHNVVIKPHPSDIQSPYKKWFSNINVISRDLPSEFLPTFLSKKFHFGITGWSTSINGLSDVLEDVINFGQDIDYKYKKLNKYFVVSELIKLFFVKYTVVLVDLDKSYIQNFLKLNNLSVCFSDDGILKNNNNSNNKKFIVVDFKKNKMKKLNNILNNLGSDDVVLCVNEELINGKLLQNDNLIVLSIEKEIIDRKKYFCKGALDYECMYLITNNYKIRDNILQMSLYKELKYSNIKFWLNLNQEEIFQTFFLKNICKVNDIIYENNKLSNRLKQQENEKSDLYIKYNNLLNENMTLIQKNENLSNQIDTILSSRSWKIMAFYRFLGKKIKKFFKK